MVAALVLFDRGWPGARPLLFELVRLLLFASSSTRSEPTAAHDWSSCIDTSEN